MWPEPWHPQTWGKNQSDPHNNPKNSGLNSRQIITQIPICDLTSCGAESHKTDWLVKKVSSSRAGLREGQCDEHEAVSPSLAHQGAHGKQCRCWQPPLKIVFQAPPRPWQLGNTGDTRSSVMKESSAGILGPSGAEQKLP